MPWISILCIGVLLSISIFSPSVQAVMLRSGRGSGPLTPEFEYWPPQWPADPMDGWNWTIRYAPYEPGPFYVPVFHDQAMPYTKRAGANVTGRFYGTGLSFGGWTTKGTRLTLTLNDESKTVVTTGGSNSSLIYMDSDRKLMRWINMTVTLEKGELQLYNFTHWGGIEGNYRDIAEVLVKDVDPTENAGTSINPYFNVSGNGDWAPQRLWEPGVFDVDAPQIVGKPGANLTFRTWPNTSFFQLHAKVGREAGMATYSVDPPPFGNPPAVEHNFSRPVDGFLTFVNLNLDPRERYTVTVMNTDPMKNFSLLDVTYLCSTDSVKDWDWRSDNAVTLNAPGNGSTGASNSSVGDSSGGNISNPDSSQSIETKKSGTNVGAIVGGVIGGVVGLVALLAALLWYFRRHRHNDNDSVVDDTTSASDAHVSYSQQPRQYSSPESPVALGENQSQQGLLSPSQDEQSYRMQESDAGPVGMDTIPPSYNSAWAGPGAAREPSPTEAPAPASGAVSDPMPGSSTAADDLAADNDTRYIQAKRDHAALFSPLTRFIQAKREHMAIFSTPEVKEAASHRDPGPLPAKGKEKASPQVKDEESPSDESDEVPRS